MDHALPLPPLPGDRDLPATEASAASEGADFTALVARHSHFMYRVAFAVLRNAHDAEDIVQETFLKLYRGRSLRNVRDEKSFLASATWRMAASRRKALRYQAAKPDLRSSEPGPEELVIDADWNAAVHRLIDALPEDLRVPLVLAGFDDLSSRQIATILDLPEGTVRTRVMRARQLLKEKLRALKEGRRG
jgi:RNA polymerase sigma-70 factor, ECF subfamily